MSEAIITDEQYGLTELHNKVKEMLADIDKIFKEHGFYYCLSDGGALGAVRHHDFIPWDDDCDILVMRDQFFEIEKVINEEHSDKYFVDSFLTNSNFTIPILRIKAKNTTFIDKRFLYNDKTTHNIFIDVFPLISIPNDIKERKKQRFNSMLCSLLTRDKTIKGKCKKSTEYILKLAPLLYGGRKRAIRKTFENICKYKYEDCDCISPILSTINYWDYLYDKSTFENPQYVDCGNIMLPIPNNTHDYLTRCYGDYMSFPPEEARLSAQHSLFYDVNNDYTLHLDKIKELREKYKGQELVVY